MGIVRRVLHGAVAAMAILTIGVLAVPACLFLGLIIAVWGASEKLLELLDGRPGGGRR